jgi:tetratricopeptide (TPR) repeat protein
MLGWETGEIALMVVRTKPLVIGSPPWELKRSLRSMMMAALLMAGGAPPAPAAPQAPPTHLQRAAELVAGGKLAEAEREAQKAVATASTAAAGYSILGTIRLRQLRLEESREMLEKALRLNPNLLGARLTLGQVFARQGKVEQAREVLRTALKQAPGNPIALMTLAQVEASAGNFQESLELVKPIRAELRRTPDGLILLQISTLGLGYTAVARGLVEDWLALTPPAPVPLAIEFAKSLAEHQLAADAVRVLEQAQGSQPPSFELAFALGGAHLANGDLARAEAYYEQAANLNANCALCNQQIARIARLQGEKEKSLSYLIKAKAQAPENAEILFEFGRACVEGNLFRDATPALEKAYQLDPSQDRYGYVLANAYMSKHRFKEALAILEKLVQKHPKDPVIYYAYGSALYNEGLRLDEAEAYLRKSIELQPKQIGAYYYLGMTVMKKGDQEQACGIFQELAERHPTHLASQEQLGTLLVKLRRNEEAKRVLEKLLEQAPQSLAGHYQYGLLLGRLGKPEESRFHLDWAKKLEEERKVESKREFYLLDPTTLDRPLTPTH